MEKIMYYGKDTNLLERLHQSFDLLPVNVRKVIESGTWPVYKYLPYNVSAIVIASDSKSVIREALNYAMCFSVPIVFYCPMDVFKSLEHFLVTHSADNKIGFVNSEAKSTEDVMEAIMSVIDMKIPYKLFQCA